MSAEVRARDLRFRYGSDPVLDGVDLEVRGGELLGLLGRNGSGKTTLLRALLGLLPGCEGEVELGATALARLGRREIARRVAWVPQDAARSFAFRVRELVAMGRNPHLGRFEPEGPRDRELIEAALAAADLRDLAERPITEISDGEWRRALVARALAQDTPVLMLDEPTANLDLAHHLELMALLRDRADRGHAVVAALHDLSEAGRWCDRLVVLREGRIAASGPPERVLTEEQLVASFGIRAEIRSEAGRVTLGPPTRVDGASDGETA